MLFPTRLRSNGWSSEPFSWSFLDCSSQRFGACLPTRNRVEGRGSTEFRMNQLWGDFCFERGAQFVQAQFPPQSPIECRIGKNPFEQDCKLCGARDGITRTRALILDRSEHHPGTICGHVPRCLSLFFPRIEKAPVNACVRALFRTGY